jgi:oligopeptidase B
MLYRPIKLPAGIILAAGILLGLSCSTAPQPPAANMIQHVDTIFNSERVDYYYWLRDRNNPEVIRYLDAENAYTQAMMKHTERLQEKLYHEMLARIKESDQSVPYKKGAYFYYTRTEEGKPYKIYCRKKGSLEAEEEILLDANALAEGKDFFRLGAYKISPDHKLLAYVVDTLGNERYTLRIKNLETGRNLPDVIDSVGTSVEWANNDKMIFYSTHDVAWRAYKLFRHVVGTGRENDVLVYHEPDEAFWLELKKTKSEKYLLMALGSETTREVHFLGADNPTGEFKIIHPRQQGMRYWIDHRGNEFFIMTDDDAKNYRIMVTPASRPGKKNWAEFVPHSDSAKIDKFELFSQYLVLYERRGGLQRIRIIHLDSNDRHEIEFPEPAYSVEQIVNPEFNSRLLRFAYESMVTPRTVFDYDLETRTSELKKQDEIPGGYNPGEYTTERIFAAADDGVMVPVSLVYKKGLVKDGNNPLFLYAYGSYGSSGDPYFNSNRLSLLDRGFVFAVAHVRGGGIMGRRWYDDGKLLKKKNTFTDFIACAEHLVEKGYTSREKLAIAGVSAGGLLIGAVVNMRPDLFKAAVADVPFVDVVNTMLDESIPLTVIEFDEWGNPKEREYYDYMMSYSPYDNVRSQDYPHMLITAGLHDTRVQYWEPAKWTAKLRSLKTDNHRLLLKTVMEAGHGGRSGRYEKLKETAFEYAFILDIFGIKE